MSRSDPAVTLGAPGLYVVPERPGPPRLGVPMDECAFVGVAPRGPAWEVVDGDDGPERAQAVPVAVRSWDDYRRLFGAFEGPGLLPFAVSAFFEQGGRVAHVVRVVSRQRAGGRPAGRAEIVLGDAVRTTAGEPVSLLARNEGAWGNGLAASLSFQVTTLPITGVAVPDRRLPVGPAPLAAGAVLRLTGGGVRRVRVVEHNERDREAGTWRAVLDQPVPGLVDVVELVEATLDVGDADVEVARLERFDHLGLLPAHPRFLGEVVTAGSRLVEPDLPPGQGVLPATPDLLPAAARATPGTGADRYELVDHRDVLDAGLPAALAEEAVASVVVADLYSPAPLAEPDDVEPPVTVAGPAFERCHRLKARRPPSRHRPPELTGLLEDPASPDGLAAIGALQAEVVAQAERARVVALLDVPPGLRPAAAQRWRRRFSSSYAAAYHPWVRVPRDGAGGRMPLVPVPPSAVAAGIVARIELAAGLGQGPANEVARDVPQVAERIRPADHGELHWSNVNVLVQEPRGVVLTGARTLSTDPAWRQLTARRVVTMVERAVAAQLQWVVFEPNNATTRTAVRTRVEDLLRRLFEAGAFRGATPAESYFVRTATDAALVAETDAGQLVCEIGVAPTEPMEFLLVRVYREGDGTLRAESGRA